jgi:hypothetical protein
MRRDFTMSDTEKQSSQEPQKSEGKKLTLSLFPPDASDEEICAWLKDEKPPAK